MLSLLGSLALGFGSKPRLGSNPSWPTCEQVEGFQMCETPDYTVLGFTKEQQEADAGIRAELQAACPATCAKCGAKSIALDKMHPDSEAVAKCRDEELPRAVDYYTPLSSPRHVQFFATTCAHHGEASPCCAGYKGEILDKQRRQLALQELGPEAHLDHGRKMWVGLFFLAVGCGVVMVLGVLGYIVVAGAPTCSSSQNEVEEWVATYRDVFENKLSDAQKSDMCQLIWKEPDEAMQKRQTPSSLHNHGANWGHLDTGFPFEDGDALNSFVKNWAYCKSKKNEVRGSTGPCQQVSSMHKLADELCADECVASN